MIIEKTVLIQVFTYFSNTVHFGLKTFPTTFEKFTYRIYAAEPKSNIQYKNNMY